MSCTREPDGGLSSPTAHLCNNLKEKKLYSIWLQDPKQFNSYAPLLTKVCFFFFLTKVLLSPDIFDDHDHRALQTEHKNNFRLFALYKNLEISTVVPGVVALLYVSTRLLYLHMFPSCALHNLLDHKDGANHILAVLNAVTLLLLLTNPSPWPSHLT